MVYLMMYLSLPMNTLIIIMNEQQKVHLAMLNSYNVIVGDVSIETILNSGIPMFAHVPNDDITPDALEFMIYYFESHDMYEHCAALQGYYNENFNEDGTPKNNLCDCELPIVYEYVEKVRCGKCNKRLTR